MMSMTERMFPEKEIVVRTYRLMLTVDVSAHDMVEAGVLVGKALQFADDLKIVKFEEVE